MEVLRPMPPTPYQYLDCSSRLHTNLLGFTGEGMGMCTRGLPWIPQSPQEALQEALGCSWEVRLAACRLPRFSRRCEHAKARYLCASLELCMQRAVIRLRPCGRRPLKLNRPRRKLLRRPQARARSVQHPIVATALAAGVIRTAASGSVRRVNPQCGIIRMTLTKNATALSFNDPTVPYTVRAVDALHRQKVCRLGSSHGRGQQAQKRGGVNKGFLHVNPKSGLQPRSV